MGLEETFAEIVRKVVREELQGISQPNDTGPLMTVDEVTAFLHYPNKQSVYKLKREGKLIAVCLGDNTIRFEREEVMRFIRDSRDEPLALRRA